MIKEEKGEFCSATLILLIHGIISFPNIDNFVDHLEVDIFLTDNPMPFLLADFYTRHERKGGTIPCCAPPLHPWMRTHMPQRGPFVSNNLSWTQSFASLSAGSILWYKKEWETNEVIFKCGGFPNVPQIGTRGCINYNHVLLKRQLGHAMVSPPEDRNLLSFVINNTYPPNPAVRRLARAWTNIFIINQEWGKKTY